MSFDALPRFHAPTRLLVMLSGSGTTLDNLIAHIESNELDATIPVLVASRECLGAKKARDAGIETHIQPAKQSPADAGALIDHLCEQHTIDLVVLAGYLKLVPITDRVRHRVVNIHPSLLPSFGGRGMHGMRVHQAVIEAAMRGEVSESGCTVHFADDEYDTGSTIVQLRCPVEPSDDAQTLASRVFELERRAYPQAIKILIERNALCNA
tara:strand:+ start:71822 stop:72451 length:630 start_codon:yes stop_codon:yes gene_type:complete